MLKITSFLKQNREDLILLAMVILISLFSFAAGFITAKEQNKVPLEIELKAGSFHTNAKSKNSHYWSRNLRPLFSS